MGGTTPARNRFSLSIFSFFDDAGLLTLEDEVDDFDTFDFFLDIFNIEVFFEATLDILGFFEDDSIWSADDWGTFGAFFGILNFTLFLDDALPASDSDSFDAFFAMLNTWIFLETISVEEDGSMSAND